MFNKSRSYAFSLTITGTLPLTEKEVKELIASSNNCVAKKQVGHQLISNVTGGAPVDETNFDKVWECLVRKGFRDAVRHKSLEGFEGLKGVQAAVSCQPKGTSLSATEETPNE